MKSKMFFPGISFALLVSTLLLSGCVGGEDFVKFRGNDYAKKEEKLQCDFSELTAIDPSDANIEGKQIFIPTNQAGSNVPTEIYISNLGACAVYNLKQ
ncbi:MAG: hypothetical protein WC602_03080 [archaeon]